VPAARADAERSRELTSSGEVWGTVGMTTLLAGLVAGTGLVIAGLSNDNKGMIYGGLGAFGGGLVLGGTFAGIGASQSSEGLALRLDAVNRYNDATWRGTTCARNDSKR
jgi:hypothetical protein